MHTWCIGVAITSDPFIVGNRVVVTCSDNVGVADRIEWLSEMGQVVASESSVQQLTLTFDPVNDTFRDSEVTCLVTRNETISTQTLPIIVIGMYECYLLLS